MPKKQDRFSKIGEPSAQFTTEDQNIILQRSVILKDNATGNIYLQLKFYNLGKTAIQSAYLKLLFFNDAGDVLNDGKETSAEYPNINCEVGKDFGAKTLIPIPTTIITIKALDIKIVLNDGAVKHYVDNQIIQLPNARSLRDTLPERYHSYLDINTQLNYQPEQISEHLYRCACGGLINDGGKCPICGRTYQEALVFASEESIRVNQENYIAEIERKKQLKEQEKQLKEQEEQLEKQSQVSKICSILLIIFGIIWCLFFRGAFAGLIIILVNIAFAILILSKNFKLYNIACKLWFIPIIVPCVIIVIQFVMGFSLPILAIFSIIFVIPYGIPLYKFKSLIQKTADHTDPNWNFSVSETAIK